MVADEKADLFCLVFIFISHQDNCANEGSELMSVLSYCWLIHTYGITNASMTRIGILSGILELASWPS
jgi:hypothetical protein